MCVSATSTPGIGGVLLPVHLGLVACVTATSMAWQRAVHVSQECSWQSLLCLIFWPVSCIHFKYKSNLSNYITLAPAVHYMCELASAPVALHHVHEHGNTRLSTERSNATRQHLSGCMDQCTTSGTPCNCLEAWINAPLAAPIRTSEAWYLHHKAHAVISFSSSIRIVTKVLTIIIAM